MTGLQSGDFRWLVSSLVTSDDWSLVWWLQMNGLQSGDYKSDDWSLVWWLQIRWLVSSLVTSDEWSTDWWLQMNGLQTGDFRWMVSSLVTSDEWSTDVATTVAGREDYFKTVRYVVLEWVLQKCVPVHPRFTLLPPGHRIRKQNSCVLQIFARLGQTPSTTFHIRPPAVLNNYKALLRTNSM